MQEVRIIVQNKFLILKSITVNLRYSPLLPCVQKCGVQKCGVQNSGVQKSGVQKSGVQKSGVQKSGVQKSGVRATTSWGRMTVNRRETTI